MDGRQGVGPARMRSHKRRRPILGHIPWRDSSYQEGQRHSRVGVQLDFLPGAIDSLVHARSCLKAASLKGLKGSVELVEAEKKPGKTAASVPAVISR